jgi:hypothetical protein
MPSLSSSVSKSPYACSLSDAAFAYSPRSSAIPPEVADRERVPALVARLVVELGRPLRELDRALLVALLRGDGAQREQRAAPSRRASPSSSQMARLSSNSAAAALVVALARGQAPGRVQARARSSGARRPPAGAPLEPAAPLGEVAAHPPELPQRSGQPQAEARLPRVERPGERLAEVVALCVHARQPGRLLGTGSDSASLRKCSAWRRLTCVRSSSAASCSRAYSRIVSSILTAVRRARAGCRRAASRRRRATRRTRRRADSSVKPPPKTTAAAKSVLLVGPEEVVAPGDVSRSAGAAPGGRARRG